MTDSNDQGSILRKLSFESIEMLRVFRERGSFREVAIEFDRDERTVSRQLVDLDKAIWSSHHVHILEREPQRRTYHLTPAGKIFVRRLELINDAIRDAIDKAASNSQQMPITRVRANRFLALFANFTAQDFKARMQHILWDSQAAIASLELSDAAKATSLLQRIIASSRWMQHQTEGLLIATRAGSPTFELVHSQKVFDETLDMLREIDQFVQDADVAPVNPPLPKVTSNKILLGFLFQNLLKNSCMYGRVGVPVTVRVTARKIGEAWHFAIEDNGIGIPASRIHAIFDSDDAQDSTAGEPKAGAGLNFCRAIVEWHGGEIWLEPRHESGSIFKFTIPVRGTK